MSPTITDLAAGTSQTGIQPPACRLPASAHVGRVRLAVSNLERSVSFYRDVIGLEVIDPGTAEVRMARLGTHDSTLVLLELEEIEGVRPIGQRTRLGLYHTAFLLPSRQALSSFVRHLAQRGTHFGSADHLCSEALYLTDPDGLSVEVYADRPRSEWRYEGREIVMSTQPLRLGELAAATDEAWKGAPAGTRVGHVHMYVGELEAAAKFYHASLGMDIATSRYPGALFVAAGGYHHHVGLNVWAAGSPVASPQDARLLFWELVLPDAAEVERVAASLRNAGYATAKTETNTGTNTRTSTGTNTGTDIRTNTRTFSDPWGITVALVAENES